MGTVIAGKAESMELLLVALLAEGHMLMEDVPGLGKTLMAKALAVCIGGTFKRVQFTASAMQPLVPLPWGISCLLFCRGNVEEATPLRWPFDGRRGPAALVLRGEHASGTRPEEEDGSRIRHPADLYDLNGEMP